MKKVIVVGGGASGLMAAITAAEQGALVTILEGMEKPGKKILVTGNGRCNLTNQDFLREDLYRSDTRGACQPVLEQFTKDDVCAYFRQCGLLVHEKNQGIYPITDQASSVLEILLARARQKKVKMKCTEKVKEICQKDGKWYVKTNTWIYEGDAVILSCGSQSYPLTGSDGSGYEIVKKLGLSIVKPMPALVPLLIREAFVKKLAGIRSNARVTLEVFNNGVCEHRYREEGEVQWTEYGLSGIVIFQLSRYAVKALDQKKEAHVILNLLPSVSREELCSFLKERTDCHFVHETLIGVLPKKMIPVIVEQAGVRQELKCADCTDTVWEKLTETVKEMRLQVKGSKSFDMAQVCQGGVSMQEVDTRTLEVKKYPGLFITGELLDVDGICGGYNLQWAWSSGYVAGKSAAERKDDQNSTVKITGYVSGSRSEKGCGKEAEDFAR